MAANFAIVFLNFWFLDQKIDSKIKKDMLVISFDEEEEFDYEFQISNSNRK